MQATVEHRGGQQQGEAELHDQDGLNHRDGAGGQGSGLQQEPDGHRPDATHPRRGADQTEDQLQSGGVFVLGDGGLALQHRGGRITHRGEHRQHNAQHRGLTAMFARC